jgi:hypothetical protein
MRLTPERCYTPANSPEPESVAVSALLPWLSLKDRRLEAGSGLLPSIPASRSVRDYWQHGWCSTVPM